MKNRLKTKVNKALFGIFSTLTCAFFSITPAFASTFSVSPMYQMISLTPGETYVGNFEIVNPGTNSYDFEYELRVEPFSVDDQDKPSLTANGDYNQITNWIELPKPTGTIAPNEHAEARFIINVPEDAPAGGQYASIVVSSGEYSIDNSNVDLREKFETAHLLYTDIAGETVRKGSIENTKVPSFMFSGPITAGSLFKNNGNVHSKSIQTIQIYPIFSKEEVYTNEEKPKEMWIMPENSLTSVIKWDQTPKIGIFRVIYNAEYEGVTKTVDKYVIICPIWLLVVILAIIFLILFKILFTGKGEKKEKR